MPKTKEKLFSQYKRVMNNKKRIGSDTPSNSKGGVLGIHFGGMSYDCELERGVRKHNIAPPRVVDLPKRATYNDIIKKGQEIFFKDCSSDIKDYYLSGTAGIPYNIEDKENWTLVDFMKSHGFVLSKFRLYIVYKKVLNKSKEYVELEDKSEVMIIEEEIVPIDEVADEDTSYGEETPPPLLKLRERKTVPQETLCNSCGRSFLAPVPDTMCHLPDGGVVCYASPITDCPLCDNLFGASWNADFMEDLAFMKTELKSTEY